MLLPEVFVGVWLCGIVTVLLIWCMRWRKIYRALHRAVPVKSGREFELLHRLETLTKSRIRIPMLRSGDMMEPGIFGIFHPLMLWPDRLSERLENEHVEGILAHELMHVRRHDNLTAAIHMLVEVVFWFHPLVWWMESRMLEERERACDEAVVQLAGRPEVYAEGLLKACRFCAESPLICVSGITGADLKDRIVRIMTEHLVQKLNLSRKLLLGGVGFVSLAIPVAFGLYTQRNPKPKIHLQRWTSTRQDRLETPQQQTRTPQLILFRLLSLQSSKLRLPTAIRWPHNSQMTEFPSEVLLSR